MTIFRLPPILSVRTTLSGQHAFRSAQDTPGPDTLIVSYGSFLIAEGSGGASGAALGSAGAWTVIVNGTVQSGISSAIWLMGGNPQVSTITVGNEGDVHGRG